MNLKLSIMTALGALALPLVAGAATWEIDASHSRVGFSVKHMMVSDVRGDFTKFSGTVTTDDKKPEAVQVDVTIDASSINTRDPKRDEHLKSPDFFDTAKNPNITFKSKSAKKAGNNKFNVVGDLTMHGVTKEVTLAVETAGKEMKDPWGNTRTAATATTKVNRKDFGLNWNKALEAGGVLVGEDVKIELEVELIKKADAAAAPAQK